MSRDLKRGDLKRNELGEAVEASVHFAEEHLKTILWTIGGVFGLALLVWGGVSWQRHRDKAANGQLAEALKVAQAPIVATGAKPDDVSSPTFASVEARLARAKPPFEEVVRDHGSTAAGASARLWLAERAMEAGDKVEARRLWQAYLDDVSSGVLSAVAQRNLWELDRGEGRGSEVLAEIRRDLERGGANLPEDLLLWELAETQVALGAEADADAALRRLVEEHGGSPFAAEARTRLAEGRGGA